MYKKSKRSSGTDSINPAAAGPHTTEPTVWEDKKRLQPTKWTVITLAAVLLVVAASALFIFKEEQKSPSVEVDRESVVSASHELEAQGNYKEAIAVYDELVEQSVGDDKSTFLSAQALIAQRAKDYKLALDYAIKADGTSSTSETLSLVGAIAAQVGDKKLALEYYEKSLEAYRNQNVREEAEEQAIQSIIDKLKAD